MKRPILIIVALLGLMGVAAIVRTGYRNAAGYCPSTGTAMTSDMMVDAAIKDIINTHNQLCSPRQTTANRSPDCATWLHYDGLADFKARNPNCCHAGYSPDGTGPPDWWWWLQLNGAHAGGVRLQYRMYGNPNDRAGMGDVSVFVENCGKTRSIK